MVGRKSECRMGLGMKDGGTRKEEKQEWVNGREGRKGRGEMDRRGMGGREGGCGMG